MIISYTVLNVHYIIKENSINMKLYNRHTRLNGHASGRDTTIFFGTMVFAIWQLFRLRRRSPSKIGFVVIKHSLRDVHWLLNRRHPNLFVDTELPILMHLTKSRSKLSLKNLSMWSKEPYSISIPYGLFSRSFATLSGSYWKWKATLWNRFLPYGVSSRCFGDSLPK